MSIGWSDPNFKHMLICVFKPIKLGPPTIWNVFFYFFGNCLRWETDEKVDMGNNKRPNTEHEYGIENGPSVVVLLLIINSICLQEGV